VCRHGMVVRSAVPRVASMPMARPQHTSADSERARGTGPRRTGRGAGAFRCMLTSREAHLQTETVLSWVGYADAR